MGEMMSEIERLKAERDEAVGEIEAAKNDLRSFMTSFVREHFPDNSGWQPLPDLLGMLSQMDNASTVARDYADKLRVSENFVARFVEDFDQRMAIGKATDLAEVELVKEARIHLCINH